ncbi:HAMP domain-containing histidine kinase [Marinobacter salinexigens]|uniref:histidine kinase n=1 Tax=Marinobacter salinexigens TaxID=2919747 RepID=A0A5B0VGN2_9GAMM|nr:HAMP domain-containing sensor histidine kinase [Marinobacter salinexigens]KAA1173776.1 HAMP domain-containing histidine kinase [Marinobacter salinexigens]
MNIKLSLRALLLVSFISLGMILMTAYSLVSDDYFIRGLDAAMASNMEKSARTFEDVVTPEQQRQGQEFSGFFISSEWLNMPDYVHRAFLQAPTEPATLYKDTNGPLFGPPDHVIFAMRYNTNSGPLYISQELVPPVESTVIPITARQKQRFTITVSVLVIVFIAIIAWLLLRHVSRPMSALRAWTHSLDRDKLSHPIPDFSYPELNEMAELIRASLTSVQDALDRERRFLRHASHELRTPISTIRSNIELQRKLALKRETISAEQAIVERIDRASLTMKHLTETLLWLNHEPDTPLDSRSIDVSMLVDELAGEMTYLLTGKQVTTKVKTKPFDCVVPPVPARIIIGNLIRNAYQHSWQGEVVIDQSGSHLIISNPVSMTEGEDSPSLQEQTGYGLGLELTDQLTRRINWEYTHRIEAGRYVVELEMSTQP